MARPGRDIEQDELLAEVWGYRAGVVSRTVTATTHRLRTKIERDPARPDHLVTVWGRGLRFQPLDEPRTSNLRPELDRFFGREREQDEVRAGLGRARLVTIVGPPGMGKTRLSREVAQRAEGFGEVWCCALSEARDGAALVRAVAATLGLHLPDGEEGELAASVGRRLAGRADVLLVLDNLEQVVADAARVVRHWLEDAPRLVVLATSREPLALGGERLVELGPLASPASAALFADRAGLADHERDEDAIAAVLARLDGLPLAIELAAGLAEVVSLRDLASRLQAPFDLLVGTRRDRPDRHRTLRRAFDGSWALLDDDERAGVAALSVFRGPFDADDAAAVLGERAVPVLRGLRARSLVARTAGRSGRLQLYPIVREWAAEHLDASDERPRVEERHRRWFARECTRRLAASGGPPTPANVDWARDHLDDLDSAWHLAVERDPDDAAALAAGLHAVLALTGPLRRDVAVLERTLAAPISPADRGHLLRYLARARHQANLEPEALRLAEQALGIARELDDPLLEGRTCAVVMSTLVALGRCAEVEAWAHRAMAAHERADDEPARASTLANLAVERWFSRRYDEAAELFARSVALHRAHGNEASAAVGLGNLGMVEAERGDDARARALVEEALAMHERLGDAVRRAMTLEHLARLHRKVGRFREALALLRSAAEATACEIGEGPALARVLHHAGVAHHFLGELDDAAAAMRRARDVATRHHTVWPILDLGLALVEADRGRADAARALVDRVEPRTPREVRVAVVLRALLANALGEPLPRRISEVRRELDEELRVSEAWLYLRRLEREVRPRGEC